VAGARQAPGERRRDPRGQIGVAGQIPVERLEPLGRLEQQRGSVAAPARGERDLPAQQVHPGAGELIERPGTLILRRREQVQGVTEGAGLHVGLRRGQRALGTPRRVGGQRHRSLQERRGRGQPAAGLRPPGRTLQLRGYLLIRPGRGLGLVPGPPIRIENRVGHLRQRGVHLVPRLDRRRPVGGRTGQRMPEPHPGSKLDQPRLYRWCPRQDADAQPPGRPPDQRRVTGRIGRRQLQQPPGLVGQSLQLAGEAVLDPARQRCRARQAKPARQLRRRQAARQLQQRQRIPPGLRDDQVTDPRVQRACQRRLQQRSRVIVPQPPDFQLRQPGQLRGRIPGREH
jgi:hypothetical protein